MSVASVDLGIFSMHGVIEVGYLGNRFRSNAFLVSVQLFATEPVGMLIFLLVALVLAAFFADWLGHPDN